MSIFSTLTDELMRVSKQVVLASLVVFGLYALGATINKYVDFSWLTNIFVLVRRVVGVFDFAFDIDTLMTLVGYALFIQVGVWIFKAIMSITQFFNER